MKYQRDRGLGYIANTEGRARIFIKTVSIRMLGLIIAHSMATIAFMAMHGYPVGS